MRFADAADREDRPPVDTEDLRRNLADFLAQVFDSGQAPILQVGQYRWGVYAFYDYDGEPIYVGQTKERLGTRIRRHLTNQRTDAVAMSVLDPYEVLEIEVWPLPQFQDTRPSDSDATRALNSLERTITELAIANSAFRAILNEKNPPPGILAHELPPSYRGRIVSDELFAARSHPDVRIARRSQVLARLAQVIAERKVGGGLRRVLLAQSIRLRSLAERRYEALGGETSVEEASDEV
jgi:hypothetical protein